jgi:hypothetical protein
MLETLFELPFALRRHREAPLLKEREEFLSHLYRQGTSRNALVTLAGLPIHVNRLLGLKTFVMSTWPRYLWPLQNGQSDALRIRAEKLARLRQRISVTVQRSGYASMGS